MMFRFLPPASIRRFTAVALAAAFLLGSTGCAYFNTFYHARKFYSQGQKADEDARKNTTTSGGGTAARGSDAYNKCIQKCERVIEEHPGSRWTDDAYLLMAKAYFGKGDYLAASRELQRLREKLPNSNLVPEASYWMGLVAYTDGDYVTAQKEWTQLLEQHPKYDGREEVEFHLAESLRQLRHYDEAAAAYAEFVETYPKGKRATDARLSLGRMLMENRRYEEAQDVFATVARRASSDESRREARVLLGDAYEMSGEKEKALETFTELEYDLDPRFTEGRMTPEEREEIVRQQQEALAAAKADSSLVKRSPYPLNDPRRSDTGDPNYDRTFDPKDPDYKPARDPGNPRYNPALDPTNPSYNPALDPDSPMYDPSLNPDNPLGTQTGNPNDPFGNNQGLNPNNLGNDPNNPYGGAQATNPNDPFTNQTQQNGVQGIPGQNPNTRQNTTVPNAGLNQAQQSLGGARLQQNNPAYRELAKVMLREGRVLAGLGRPWEAILAYEQVMAEYPRTEFAAEAQYRIGYTQEVYLEDFDAAEEAYGKVQGHGQSTFIEEAQRRARNLGTAKRLSAALSDSTNQAVAASAEAHFVRAELYLFQQEKPERAVEEYELIQKEMAGTEFAAKAALAEAFVRFSVMADTARGRAKYAEVMRDYANTEYGYQARRVIRGPEREPAEKDFMGPSLEDLLTDANMAVVSARDSTLRAAANPPPKPASTADSLAAAGGLVPGSAGLVPGNGGPPSPGGKSPPPGRPPGNVPVAEVLTPPGGGAVAPMPGPGGAAPPGVNDPLDGAPALKLPSDPMAVPAGGPSPILTASERAARRAAAPVAAPPPADALTVSPPDSSRGAAPDTTQHSEEARSLADIKRQAKALTPEQARAMLDSLNAIQDADRAREDSTSAPADSTGRRNRSRAPADSTHVRPPGGARPDTTGRGGDR